MEHTFQGYLRVLENLNNFLGWTQNLTHIQSQLESSEESSLNLFEIRVLITPLQRPIYYEYRRHKGITVEIFTPC